VVKRKFKGAPSLTYGHSSLLAGLSRMPLPISIFPSLTSTKKAEEQRSFAR
jgi:hypothetical protein